MDTHLNLINLAQGYDDFKIVIYQINEVDRKYEYTLPIAWKAISHLGYVDNHPFVFSMEMEISVNDGYGNLSPLIPVSNGQQFQIERTGSGERIFHTGEAYSPNQIQCFNNTDYPKYTLYIFKDRRFLAISNSLAPGGVTLFEFQPKIWIGITTEKAEEGQFIDPKIFGYNLTSIPLSGIKSADIIITGKAGIYFSELENVELY